LDLSGPLDFTEIVDHVVPVDLEQGLEQQLAADQFLVSPLDFLHFVSFSEEAFASTIVSLLDREHGFLRVLSLAFDDPDLFPQLPDLQFQLPLFARIAI